jgi:hypothetical protein
MDAVIAFKVGIIAYSLFSIDRVVSGVESSNARMPIFQTSLERIALVAQGG